VRREKKHVYTCAAGAAARARARERVCRETEGSGFGIRGTYSYTALTLLHQSPEPLRQSPTDRGTNALAVWVP